MMHRVWRRRVFKWTVAVAAAVILLAVGLFMRERESYSCGCHRRVPQRAGGVGIGKWQWLHIDGEHLCQSW
jgi:hypothetical protein